MITLATLEAAEQRAEVERIPFEDALALVLCQTEASAVPSNVREVHEAFLRSDRYRAWRTMREQRAAACRPPLIFTVPDQAVAETTNRGPETKMQNQMTPEETRIAQQLIARMRQPLSDDERDVCRKLGMTEEAFKAERDRELGNALPGWHAGMEHGLSAEEVETAAALGMTPEAFAKARKVA